MRQVSEVFGVSTFILPDSYVDRGALDEQIGRYLARDAHLALRGASKSGKSWLRQRVVPDAIVVQCRLGKTVLDIYKQALGELGIRLVVNQTDSQSLTGTVEASAEAGIKLVAKVAAKFGYQKVSAQSIMTEPISQDVHDLRFVADLLLESGRRLVIEDYHYLSDEERRKFAFDLKALWDYGVYLVIVGVWSDRNLLLHLNPDLTSRVREAAITWSSDDLRRIFAQGGEALNLCFSEELQTRAIADCYGNAGILQRLIVDTLDYLGIDEEQDSRLLVQDLSALEHAELYYAEELNTVYQRFAQRVSSGIRTRSGSTGIYAHTLAVALAATDDELISGIHIDRIFVEAHAREPRIIKGNLRLALAKIEGLQVDSEGRGLVLSYADEHVRVVDQQLLLYRKYSTVRWPWEDMIQEAERTGEDFASA